VPEEGKKIRSIEIDEQCSMGRPCRHFVRVDYEDGTVENAVMDAISITKYLHQLRKANAHFMSYGS
jgi:hypothetical protein